MLKQAHLFISGTVQGIGYRQFVKSNAQKLDLTGWVRNTEDGGVEVVLQGAEPMITMMIEQCKQGPFMAEVKQLGFEWEEIEEQFVDFTIR
ncbi:MAG: acylphosphatase [Candidatus Levyibacteriota bacterium]